MPLPVGAMLRKVGALDLQLPPLAREEMIPERLFGNQLSV